MKKVILAIPAILLLLIPVISYGAAIEGTIQGYNCIMQGKTCPVGGEDPLVQTENTFVLLTNDGKSYFFIPNVDRAILARHVAEHVKITGDVNPQNNAIRANVIQTEKNGMWKTAWAKDQQFGAP
jgi:hypothetical protein